MALDSTQDRGHIFPQYWLSLAGENNFYFFLKINEMLTKRITNNHGKILITLNKFWASR